MKRACVMLAQIFSPFRNGLVLCEMFLTVVCGDVSAVVRGGVLTLCVRMLLTWCVEMFLTVVCGDVLTLVKFFVSPGA